MGRSHGNVLLLPSAEGLVETPPSRPGPVNVHTAVVARSGSGPVPDGVARSIDGYEWDRDWSGWGRGRRSLRHRAPSRLPSRTSVHRPSPHH